MTTAEQINSLAPRQRRKFRRLEPHGAEIVDGNVLPPDVRGTRTWRDPQDTDPHEHTTRCPLCKHVLQPMHNEFSKWWCPDCHKGFNVA